MIDKEKATGLGSSNHADCYGAACLDLGDEISAGDRALLPFGLVRAFVITYCDQCPRFGELIELLDKVCGHMIRERPTEFGR